MNSLFIKWMKSTLTIFVLLVLSLPFPAAAQDMAGGLVSDYSDSNVEGAKVNVFHDNKWLSDITDSQGMFGISLTPVSVEQDMLRYNGDIYLTVYNIAGQKIRSEVFNGLNRIIWDRKDDFGRNVANGIYLYRIKAGDKMFTGKVPFGSSVIIDNFNNAAAKAAVLMLPFEVGKDGYETLHDTLAVSNDMKLVINRIPQLVSDLPDTIGVGYDLNGHVFDDGSGLWVADNGIKVVDGILDVVDGTQSLLSLVDILYKDNVNDNLVLNFSSVFKYEAAYVSAPFVSEISLYDILFDPALGFLDSLSLRPEFKVKFNENVTVNADSVGVYDSNGNEVSTEKIVSEDGILVKPVNDLKYLKDYNFTVGGVKDLAGNGFSGYKLDFRTMERPYRIITGKITEFFEVGKPVENVDIRTNLEWGVKTDSEGNFTIKANTKEERLRINGPSHLASGIILPASYADTTIAWDIARSAESETWNRIKNTLYQHIQNREYGEILKYKEDLQQVLVELDEQKGIDPYYFRWYFLGYHHRPDARGTYLCFNEETAPDTVFVAGYVQRDGRVHSMGFQNVEQLNEIAKTINEEGNALTRGLFSEEKTTIAICHNRFAHPDSIAKFEYENMEVVPEELYPLSNWRNYDGGKGTMKIEAHPSVLGGNGTAYNNDNKGDVVIYTVLLLRYDLDRERIGRVISEEFIAGIVGEIESELGYPSIIERLQFVGLKDPSNHDVRMMNLIYARGPGRVYPDLPKGF